MCTKMADVLVARAHEIVAEVFTEAKRDPEIEQSVEDVIAQRLQEELGMKLSPEDEKKLAVDAKFIGEQKGASNAAATVLGRVFGLETGRSVYSAAEKSREAPPVPGPLNRWVPQQYVRKYLVQLVTWTEEVRRATPLLALSELRDKTRSEAIIDRVERRFRRKGLAAAERDEHAAARMLGDILRGGPVPEKFAAAWIPYQSALDKIRAQLKAVEMHVLENRGPAEAASAVDEMIKILTELWLTELKKDLDLIGPYSPT